MAFSSNNILLYAIGAAGIIIASYVVTQYKKTLEPDDEYDMIKKYLLNFCLKLNLKNKSFVSNY
jgi:hypothetical protein